MRTCLWMLSIIGFEVVFDSFLNCLHAAGMSNRSPVFAQIMQALDPTEFARCVAGFPSPRRPRGLSAYDHFLALCFAQLTYRESLRDIAACLQARSARAYHLGFRSRITRTNLAYANQHRDWRLFAAVAQILMPRAQALYQDEPAVTAEGPALVYALDASLIELSCTLFPWAYWQQNFAAVKLHTLLNLRSNLPAWCVVTEATCSDVRMLTQVPLMPGAFYILDRGYLDFPRLAQLDHAGVSFVVRAKVRLHFRVQTARPVDKTIGLRCDQTIVLTGKLSRLVKFTGPLRRVHVHDPTTGNSLILFTNNFELPAQTIGQLYRRRWQVELFFKWIKQHLRLRAFFGRTPNAVQAQIWTAICAYLLTAIARKQMNLSQSLHQILQIVSVSAFEQTPLPELVAENIPQTFPTESANQLNFNNI
jgi:hypothetical protein